MSQSAPSLRFWVPGVSVNQKREKAAHAPISQGSARLARHRKTREKMLVTKTPELRAWRAAIMFAARAAAHDAQAFAWRSYGGPVLMGACFVFARPKSRKNGSVLDAFKATQSDLDKLMRAVGDGLEEAKLIQNDGQIVAHWPPPAKVYGLDPGAWIYLRALDDSLATTILRHHMKERD